MNSDLQRYAAPIAIGAIWSIIWKGLALWRAARNQDKAWFIALLIINTVGILDIFYLFVFSKRSHRNDKSSS